MASLDRLAVVLFNLGGPDGPAAVEPFLFNLFSDPAIIRLPGPLRWLIAKIISRRRAPVARRIYAHLGGGSPLLANTEAQARALQTVLADAAKEVRVFIAMRYWHPFSAEPGMIEALVQLTESALVEAARRAPGAKVRLIFTAHGLPVKIVKAGDPYVEHVSATCEGVMARLQAEPEEWVLGFQSRVGPVEWIGPSTEELIAEAAKENRAIVVLPVAFVSEHSETLVELDIDYRKLAEARGAPAFIRVPAVATHPAFIAGLGRIVRQALRDGRPVVSFGSCPAESRGCPCRASNRGAQA